MCLQPFTPLENDVKSMKTIVMNYSKSHLLQHVQVSCVLMKQHFTWLLMNLKRTSPLPAHGSHIPAVRHVFILQKAVCLRSQRLRQPPLVSLLEKHFRNWDILQDGVLRSIPGSEAGGRRRAESRWHTTEKCEEAPERPNRAQHCSFIWELFHLRSVCVSVTCCCLVHIVHLCEFAHAWRIFISPCSVYLHVLFLSCSALSSRGGRKLLSANATLISKCFHNLTAEVLCDMLKPFLGFWLNYWGRCCGKLQSAKSFRQTAFFVHERDQHMESLMHTTQNWP